MTQGSVGPLRLLVGSQSVLDSRQSSPMMEPVDREGPTNNVRLVSEAAERLGANSMEPIAVSKDAPRYIHAQVTFPDEPGRFRLKVVNPERSDSVQIGPCCEVANLVHSGLESLASWIDFGIPHWRSISRELFSTVYVAQEVSGGSPDLEAAEVADSIVDHLLQLELATARLDLPFGRKPPWINSCNRSGYLSRLQHSLRGLEESGQISPAFRELAISAFDKYWNLGALDSARTLCHGDFSAGNIRQDVSALWLIDFEHSQVGVPALDVAHLYGNLVFQGRVEPAAYLRDSYFAERSRRGLHRLDEAFGALLIERLAGKWNAMDRDLERRSRAHDLLQLAVQGRC